MTTKLRLRVAREVMSAAFAADRLRTVGSALLIFVSAAPGLLTAFAIKAVAEGLLRGDARHAIEGAALAAAGVAAGLLANSAAIAVRYQAREKTTHELALRMARAAATVPTLEHLERADYADRVELARAGRAVMASALDVLLLTAAAVLQIVVTIAVLLRVHPTLGALALFAIPSLVVSARATRKVQDLAAVQAERRRLEHHLFDVAASVPGGIEARVLGHQHVLVARRRILHQELERERRHLDRRLRVESLGAAALLAAGVVGAVTLVAGSVTRGRPPTDLVLVLALGAQLRSQVTGLRDAGGGLLTTLTAGERYLWLMDHARHATNALRPADPKPVPTTLSTGVAFHHVRFRYPNTNANALEDVTVDFPRGSVIAIVGDNGAGKTTLVKLLMRAYDPDDGTITIDGIDLRDIHPDEWRQQLTAAFQDFARFELPAGETVGTGDLPRINDAASIETAVDRAGATGVLIALPDGLATQLGRSFDSGVDLSGGQWQQLALARAMMRDDPLVLILDEPTSNLDALAEQRLFDRYITASRRAAQATGAIALIVSHRFSTVARADLIVVIDHGRVTEVGSHEALLSAQGTYAELYELQARAYRSGSSEGGRTEDDSASPTASTAAIDAVSGAREQARMRGEAVIGQEHLIVAVADIPDSSAHRCLEDLGISLADLADALRSPERATPTNAQPVPTPRLLAAIQHAEAEARRESRPVTTTDLIVGILACREGVGHVALTRAGATSDSLRRAHAGARDVELSSTSTISLTDALAGKTA